jgi:hypothetical protein
VPPSNMKNTRNSLKIAGSLDFVHRPVFYKLENTTLRKLDLFPSSGERAKTPAQLGPLERAKLNLSIVI